MTSPISTALACTNEPGSTTGVTPLIADFHRIASSHGSTSLPRSADPDARVAEHPHPRAVLAPFLRVPRLLHRAEHALRVRHEDGEAPVRRREAGDAAGEPLGFIG